MASNDPLLQPYKLKHLTLRNRIMQKRVTFRHLTLPYLFILPQLAITIVFFIWPAGEAIYQSLLRQDAFGLSTQFVGFDNFERLFADPLYIDTLWRTLGFSVSVTLLSMLSALLFAVMADHVIRGATTYKTLLIWPYAVAPAIAGVLWWFLFNPSVGILAYLLQGLGYDWNPFLDGDDAMKLFFVILAAVVGIAIVGYLGYVWYVNDVEQPEYGAVVQDGDFEIRDYPAMPVAGLDDAKVVYCSELCATVGASGPERPLR